MARPRQIQSTPQITPGQATYIVEKLLTERRISAGEVSRYIGDMQREIGDLERRLDELRAAAAGVIGAVRGIRGPRRGRPAGRSRKAALADTTAAAPRKRRKPAITPERLASRQLQGRYLGLIRQIPATRRAQYKRIAAERGREAAIKEMMTALKK